MTFYISFILKNNHRIRTHWTLYNTTTAFHPLTTTQSINPQQCPPPKPLKQPVCKTTLAQTTGFAIRTRNIAYVLNSPFLQIPIHPSHQRSLLTKHNSDPLPVAASSPDSKIPSTTTSTTAGPDASLKIRPVCLLPFSADLLGDHITRPQNKIPFFDAEYWNDYDQFVWEWYLGDIMIPRFFSQSILYDGFFVENLSITFVSRFLFVWLDR